MTEGAGAALEGATVLVTGAGSGIGRAGAHGFAARGARVVVVDIDGDGAESTTAEITASGGTALAVVADVTDEAQVRDLVIGVTDRFGALDAAWNNAGGGLTEAPLHETALDDWRRSIDLNLTSVFLCMKHEITVMLELGGGAIVNTASGAARVPAPGRPHYSAAKRGVVALTAHGAQDYRRRGIRVNAVLPGMIETPGVQAAVLDQHGREAIEPYLPLKRLGQPEEVAELAVWLCSPAAGYVNGQAIVVDGGGILA